MTAKVLTPQDVPLSGVQVVVYIHTPLGNQRGSGGPRTVLSDAQGRITLDHLRPESTITFTSATKSGYQFVTGGTVTKVDGTFHMTDMVLAARTATVTGTVVDINGKPLTGVKVTSLGVEEPVVTDGIGRFTLTEMPEGEVMLMAAHERAGARCTVTAGEQPVTLTLLEPISPKPHDVARAADLLEYLWTESQGKDYYARGSLAGMLQKDAANMVEPPAADPDDDHALVAIIEETAKRDPAHAEALLPKLELPPFFFPRPVAHYTDTTSQYTPW